MNWLLPSAAILTGLTGSVRTIRDTTTSVVSRPRTEAELRARRKYYYRNQEKERAAARKRMAAVYARRKAA